MISPMGTMHRAHTLLRVRFIEPLHLHRQARRLSYRVNGLKVFTLFFASIILHLVTCNLHFLYLFSIFFLTGRPADWLTSERMKPVTYYTSHITHHLSLYSIRYTLYAKRYPLFSLLFCLL